MIITGCQRSGTQTAATIFGIPHEVQFTPESTWNNVCELKPIQPESSWLAKPFLSLFKDRNIPVIHLVRHPINVINSLLGISFFDSHSESNEAHKPYRDYLNIHLPGITKIHNLVTQAFYYYIYWNKPLEDFPRIKIESIANAPHMNARPRSNYSWEKLEELCENERLVVDMLQLMDKYGYET